MPTRELQFPFSSISFYVPVGNNYCPLEHKSLLGERWTEEAENNSVVIKKSSEFEKIFYL